MKLFISAFAFIYFAQTFFCKCRFYPPTYAEKSWRSENIIPPPPPPQTRISLTSNHSVYHPWVTAEGPRTREIAHAIHNIIRRRRSIIKSLVTLRTCPNRGKWWQYKRKKCRRQELSGRLNDGRNRLRGINRGYPL